MIAGGILRFVSALALVSVPVLGGFAAPPAQAVSTTTAPSVQSSFLKAAVPLAQDAQGKYGTPASVQIAQAIEATDWGRNRLATDAKNYFGAPCGMSLTASGFASTAEAQVGKPYVLGAETSPYDSNPPKFDCSELVEWLYARSGNKITDLAASQYAVTKAVPHSSPRVGDLVFLRNNPARSNGIGHVAIVTSKMSNGDWRIIEARGRAWGVVRSTLSDWRSRKYYAGLRRYTPLKLAGESGMALSATAYRYQVGCVTLTIAGKASKYRKYTSMANSFTDNALTQKSTKEYAAARSVASDVNAYIDAIAKVQRPASASAYAAKLKAIVNANRLTSYDVVPLTMSLRAGASGEKVKALQLLLKAAGQSVSVTGSYDTQMVAAVKSFQRAQRLTVDGEAGSQVFGRLLATTSSTSAGSRIAAANTLLRYLGYSIGGSTSSFGPATTSAVRDLQRRTGLIVNGKVDRNTWARLFMALDPAPLPTIAGSTTVDQTLTASAGAWGPGGVALAYQWYRDGSAVAGATGTSYELQPSDAGARITLRISGSGGAYTSLNRTSKATSAVAKAPLTSTPVPTISGSVRVGGVVSAAAGTWGPTSVSLAYQWFRNGERITGANAATYAVPARDLGAVLSVTVTGSKDGYVTVSRTSTTTPKVEVGRFSATPKPAISGAARVGSALTAVPGTWTPTPDTLTYQWYRGANPITGATKPSYTPKAGDLGQTIKVAVRATSAGYTSVRTVSSATAKVGPGVFTSAPTPTVSGKTAVGSRLTVATGAWTPKPSKLAYQWYRGTTKITGATASTYRLVSADRGKTVTVKITASKAGFTSVTKSAKVKIA